MPEQKLRIGIVGGSITGLALHLFLKEYGIQSTVLEATRPEFSRSGGVFGLGHPALCALERVGVVQDDFVTVTNERVMEYMPGRPAPEVSTYAGRTTVWNALHAALVARVAPGAVREGVRVGHAYFGHRSGVVDLVTESNCPIGQFDLVIGADGRGSTLRSIVDPGRKLHYSGYVMFRGLSDECPDGYQETFTRHLKDGIEFNTFPVDGGKRMDWVLHAPVSRASWHYLFTPKGDGGQVPGLWEPEQRLFIPPNQVRGAARKYADDLANLTLPPNLARLVKGTHFRMALPTVDIDAPTTMRFWRDKVLLLGDALAPMRSHTARGANNGIEQADDLAGTLHQVMRYGADPGAALAGWEERHLARMQSYVKIGPVLAARKIQLGSGTPLDAAQQVAGS